MEPHKISLQLPTQSHLIAHHVCVGQFPEGSCARWMCGSLISTDVFKQSTSTLCLIVFPVYVLLFQMFLFVFIYLLFNSSNTLSEEDWVLLLFLFMYSCCTQTHFKPLNIQTPDVPLCLSLSSPT